jgi:hypothetical protein
VRRSSSCVLLAVSLLAAACGGSEPAAYDTQDVTDALRANGFEIAFECGSEERTLESESCVGDRRGKAVTFLSAVLAAGKVENVRSVVVANSSQDPGVTAWILESEALAESWLRGWSGPNEIAVRLQERNVVVLVPKSQQASARAAVEELG